MKPPPSDAEIVEEIITALGLPLRHPEEKARAEIKSAIKMLREASSRPFPNAAAINKHAKSLRQELEPLGDELQVRLRAVVGAQ